MSANDVLTNETSDQPIAGVRKSKWGRLVDSQTAIDFIGARKWGFLVSGLLIVVTAISFFTQGLNLGIDFEGGISWDVPAANFTIDDAHRVLEENGLSAEGARIQERQSEATDFIKIQVADQPEEVGTQMKAKFAEAAGVNPDEVNVNLVSSSWGSEITDKAIRALVIFLALVAVFISIRFEWRMAIAAILAMLHDVVISVGLYSIFQFLVTPPTVIAFLTILGYSLYDTIVVFDRIRENEARFLSQKPPYEDVINVSMNQVLMRSIMTTFSSVIPVLSMLVVGAWIMGQTTLEEFGLALLIGLITGAYSSLFIAAPLLGYLKKTDARWTSRAPHAKGEALREMVVTGHIAGTRRVRPRPAMAVAGEGGEVTVDPVDPGPADPHEQATTLLSHPPRPRKKTRR